jgi:hypothetical protein
VVVGRNVGSGGGLQVEVRYEPNRLEEEHLVNAYELALPRVQPDVNPGQKKKQVKAVTKVDLETRLRVRR